MKIINCTPHEINVVTDKGIVTYPKTDNVANIPVSPVTKMTIGGVNIVDTEFGELTGLPDQQEDTMFIVSRMVKSAVPHRTDLLVPGIPVRDEKGTIIGCKNLSLT